MLNIIDLTFEFEFGVLDGRSMTVEIISGDQTFTANTLTNTITVERITLPSQIKLAFLGKVPGRDTKVDNQGNIIADMYVKITKMLIDNLQVPTWALQKNLIYVTDDGKSLTTSYIGFNGTMTIDIPKSTVFSFYQRLTSDHKY